MDTIKLAVRTREETGNGPSRRFRAAGQVPAVAYGKGHEATPIVIAIDDLRAALAHVLPPSVDTCTELMP